MGAKITVFWMASCGFLVPRVMLVQLAQRAPAVHEEASGLALSTSATEHFRAPPHLERLGRLVWLLDGQRGPAPLQDTPLLPRNLGDGVAEHLDVVHPQGGDPGDLSRERQRQ